MSRTPATPEPLEGAEARRPILYAVADPAPLGLAAFAMTTFASASPTPTSGPVVQTPPSPCSRVRGLCSAAGWHVGVRAQEHFRRPRLHVFWIFLDHLLRARQIRPAGSSGGKLRQRPSQCCWASSSLAGSSSPPT